MGFSSKQAFPALISDLISAGGRIWVLTLRPALIPTQGHTYRHTHIYILYYILIPNP